ncbi:MAG: hypothetical protein A2Y10_19925 [Planctomycetes bacterium GWF2_41_51]|nr:MAG: hypothetical protein A2Y10_19925 [Planctomycetes bacterium GWF2_41_51]HBG28554.1 hypothetical protein [Phycisphaerales bacterium]
MEQSSKYIYDFTFADYYIMIGYLVLLISVGFILKKKVSNVKDYYIGGNNIPWWMAGASCFMMSFSAWTFTGAAGFAYNNGIVIILLFLFNVIAFIFCAFFVAAKCRQTRKISYLEIVRSRFGRATEQFFLWIQVPTMLFGGAIWLVGLATFVSVAFGIPIQVTIVISGIVVLIYSTLSGSWGIMTADFLHSLVLLVLSIVISILTLIKIGGLQDFVTKVDPEKLKLFSEQHNVIWVVAYFFQIFLIFNSIQYAPRFLAVKDGLSARKAALTAALLFFIGPIIWFFPPIAATYLFPDIGKIVPQLSHPQDAAYVLIGLEVLPKGLAGLLIMMIFVATLSSMDAAINQNAALISMNLYKPLFRPKASEREQFNAARIINILLGFCVIVLASFFAKQKEFALFDLMLFLLASIGLPVAVPFVLIYWVKKTSRNAAIISTLGGILFSFLTEHYIFFSNKESCIICEYLRFFGINSFDLHYEWPFALRVFGTIGVSTALFFVTRFVWKKNSEEYQQKVDEFYNIMNKPIDVDKESSGSGAMQHFMIVGILSLVAGVGILVLLFFTNRWLDRFAILLTGLMIFMAGLVMLLIARYKKAH